jgi:hypothetical protein
MTSVYACPASSAPSRDTSLTGKFIFAPNAGKVVHLNDVLAMDPSERLYILQIDEELFQVPFWPGYNEPADFINHSCDPNAGFGKYVQTYRLCLSMRFLC